MSSSRGCQLYRPLDSGYQFPLLKAMLHIFQHLLRTNLADRSGRLSTQPAVFFYPSPYEVPLWLVAEPSGVRAEDKYLVSFLTNRLQLL
jgi:hypothetical protein